MTKTLIIDGEETNYEITDDGHIYNKTTGRELKGTYTTNEYHSVMLTIKGKSRVFLFHRLLAEAFLPNPDNLPVVDHIDRDKHNDALSNLRWASYSDNVKNADTTRRTDITVGDYEDKEWRLVLDAPEYKISQDGIVIKISTGRVLKPQDRNGYYRYNINKKMRSAHIMVWEAFNGKKVPEGYQIDHINGIKNDNRIENLRAVTPSENMYNAYKHGHRMSKAVNQYTKSGDLVAAYSSYQKAADTIQVTEAAIRTAAERKGTCGGYYWLLDGVDFEKVHGNDWAPEGYVILPDTPDYCANEAGVVLSKRTKKPLKVQYYSSGEPFVQLHRSRLKVQDVIEQVKQILSL